jgi:hypothetical protein
MKEKIEVDKFKKLIKDMFRGFPNWQYKGMVEQVIVTENMRNELIKSGYLIKEEHRKDNQDFNIYMLGPNALPLVSAWETEELTKKIKGLTIAVITLTIISVGISTIALLI